MNVQYIYPRPSPYEQLHHPAFHTKARTILAQCVYHSHGRFLTMILKNVFLFLEHHESRSGMYGWPEQTDDKLVYIFYATNTSQ